MEATKILNKEDNDKILQNQNTRFKKAKVVFGSLMASGAALGGVYAILGYNRIPVINNDTIKPNNPDSIVPQPEKMVKVETDPNASLDEKHAHAFKEAGVNGYFTHEDKPIPTALGDFAKGIDSSTLNKIATEVIKLHKQEIQEQNDNAPEATPIMDIDNLHKIDLSNITDKPLAQILAEAAHLHGKGVVVHYNGKDYSTYSTEDNETLKNIDAKLDVHNQNLETISKSEMEQYEVNTIVHEPTERIAYIDVHKGDEINTQYITAHSPDGSILVYEDVDKDGTYDMPIGEFKGVDENGQMIIEPFHKPEDWKNHIEAHHDDPSPSEITPQTGSENLAASIEGASVGVFDNNSNQFQITVDPHGDHSNFTAEATTCNVDPKIESETPNNVPFDIDKLPTHEPVAVDDNLTPDKQEPTEGSYGTSGGVEVIGNDTNQTGTTNEGNHYNPLPTEGFADPNRGESIMGIDTNQTGITHGGNHSDQQDNSNQQNEGNSDMAPGADLGI